MNTEWWKKQPFGELDESAISAIKDAYDVVDNQEDDTEIIPAELMTLDSFRAKNNMLWAFSGGLGIEFNW